MFKKKNDNWFSCANALSRAKARFVWVMFSYFQASLMEMYHDGFDLAFAYYIIIWYVHLFWGLHALPIQKLCYKCNHLSWVVWREGTSRTGPCFFKISSGFFLRYLWNLHHLLSSSPFSQVCVTVWLHQSIHRNMFLPLCKDGRNVFSHLSTTRVLLNNPHFIEKTCLDS